MRTRLCRKTPSSARERAILSPGKDGEAGDVCSIVDAAGCGQAAKGPLEARSSFPAQPTRLLMCVGAILLGLWALPSSMAATVTPAASKATATLADVDAREENWSHYLGPNFDLRPGSKRFHATSVAELWQAEVKTGMCSVTVVDGLLYTMGNDGTKDKEQEARDRVYCLDAETGEEEWVFDYACSLDPRLHPGGPSATPTVHEGKVYTCSKFGHIYCLDAKTGRKLWEASAEHYKPRKPWWGFAASPTVMGEVVVYNIGDRGMALNKDTGQIVWQSEKSVVAYATPKPLPAELFHRPAVALLTNEALLVLDPMSGQSVATYTKSWKEKSNCNGVTPYIHRGHVYLVHSGHGMSRLSIDGNRLTEDWLATEGKYPNEWFAFNTHVIQGDHIFYLTKGKKSGTGLRCVNAETGKQVSLDEKYAFGNLLAVGNTLIMLSEEGELIWGELNNTTFEEAYRKKILKGLCWAKPVILGKRLYARDAEGTVVCLRLL